MEATHILEHRSCLQGQPIYFSIKNEEVEPSISFYIGDKAELIRYASLKRTASGTAAIVRLSNGTIRWIDSEYIGRSI